MFNVLKSLKNKKLLFISLVALMPSLQAFAGGYNYQAWVNDHGEEVKNIIKTKDKEAVIDFSEEGLRKYYSGLQSDQQDSVENAKKRAYSFQMFLQLFRDQFSYAPILGGAQELHGFRFRVTISNQAVERVAARAIRGLVGQAYYGDLEIVSEDYFTSDAAVKLMNLEQEEFETRFLKDKKVKNFKELFYKNKQVDSAYSEDTHSSDLVNELENIHSDNLNILEGARANALIGILTLEENKSEIADLNLIQQVNPVPVQAIQGRIPDNNLNLNSLQTYTIETHCLETKESSSSLKNSQICENIQNSRYFNRYTTIALPMGVASLAYFWMVMNQFMHSYND